MTVFASVILAFFFSTKAKPVSDLYSVEFSKTFLAPAMAQEFVGPFSREYYRDLNFIFFAPPAYFDLL